jgi:thiamine transporter ThiT
MQYLKQFLMFWYDFIVGDDWVVAVGVAAALVLLTQLVSRSVNAWWLMPLAVVGLLALSLRRGTQKKS